MHREAKEDRRGRQTKVPPNACLCSFLTVTQVVPDKPEQAKRFPKLSANVRIAAELEAQRLTQEATITGRFRKAEHVFGNKFPEICILPNSVSAGICTCKEKTIL